MNKHHQSLLISSLDCELSDRQKSDLQAALQSSPELQAEKTKILKIRSALSKSAAQGFETGFVDRVMARISPDLSGQLFRFFRPVAVAAMLVIVIIISINLVNSGQVTFGSAIGITEVSPEEAFNPMVDLIRE